jgi:serine/threonine protein kinase
MTVAAGDTLGRYRVGRLLGVGAAGAVYEATSLALERRVALKILTREKADKDWFRQQFFREARHAAELAHPNILPIYEAGEDQGCLFLVMRLIDGGSLEDRTTSGSLTLGDGLRVLADVASALDAVHAGGFAHRDVKPSNVLLSSSGSAFLADFGVSSYIRRAAEGELFVGTPAYAAPEQIRGDAITGACDIYSLTAILYQCLVGVPPFVSSTRAEVELAHLMNPPPRLPALNAAHEELDEVIQRGMAKDPSDRFDTAAALLNAAHSAAATLDLGQPFLMALNASAIGKPKLVAPTTVRESGIGGQGAAGLSHVQRRILLALCRPLSTEGAYAAPASNLEIAAELSLSVDAVRMHLRFLYSKYGLGDVSQNRKRVALAEVALNLGLAPRD